MQTVENNLTSEECVAIVRHMSRYLGTLLRASDFLRIERDNLGPDDVDDLLKRYEFQPGYLLEHVLERRLLKTMLLPYLPDMIENELDKKPVITWPDTLTGETK